MPQPQQLPGPNADIWDWQMNGVCRGVDSSMFFHPDGERAVAREPYLDAVSLRERAGQPGQVERARIVVPVHRVRPRRRCSGE